MTYTPIPETELAAIVTYLEMLHPPAEQPPPPSSLSLRRLQQPSVNQYRALFRLVGSRWLWFSRLAMPGEALAAIIHHRKVELFAVVDAAGADCGMVELDLREPGQCELAFIGLVPGLAGQGHGRWLLAESLRLAWREGIERVHVHTCSLDHPAALAAYRRAGFVPCKRAIETFPDPRLLGILPLDCAPQVPVLGTVTSTASAPESWT